MVQEKGSGFGGEKMLLHNKILVVAFIALLVFHNVQAQRLPIVDGDEDEWGTVLNNFLNISFDSGGNIRSEKINTTTILDGTIIGDDISTTAQIILANLSIADNITSEANFTNLDSIISDFIYPESSQFTTIKNATILQDLRVLGSSYLSSFTISDDLIIGQNNLSSTFLGVGTQSPSFPLHINISDSTNNSIVEIFTLERSNSSDALVNGYGSSILFRLQDDAGEIENVSQIAGILTDISNGTEKGALVFYTGYADSNGKISNLSSQEAMRINANTNVSMEGNLMIKEGLEIFKNLTLSDSILTNFIFHESNQDIKIENVSILEDLHIIGKVYGNSLLSFGSLSHFDQNVTFADNLTVDGNTFYVDASTNKVGIGTISPTEQLEVNGNITTTGIKIGNEGTFISNYFSTTANVDFGATLANTCDDINVTVTGVIEGDVVALGTPNAVRAADTDTTLTGWAADTNIVTMRRCNQDAVTAAANPPLVTIRIGVWQH